jgi:hypothetical protein
LPSPVPGPCAETLAPGVAGEALKLATSLHTVAVSVHAAPAAGGLGPLVEELADFGFSGHLDLSDLWRWVRAGKRGPGESAGGREG